MHDRPRLVPDDFNVPATLEHPRFRLRMLTVNDLVGDYDAVMSSVDHLRTTPGERQRLARRPDAGG